MTFHTNLAEQPSLSAQVDHSQLIADLEAVLGPQWVETDPCLLDTYAWQYLAEATHGSNYLPRPIAVALPGDTQDVAAIVRLCNTHGVQYKAFSTGMGVWAGPAVPNRVVQIDLRRMDQIVRIDEENMYAVIQPYVTGNQLQTEAMRVGLNTHIAGCGAQASVLASATSMMGQSGDGISMGFSNRNLLGFEWVTPDGQVVQCGSFDASGDDFLGDGPGFSIRGIIRGFAGALGGLGVFTRAAVKLYPWEGPAHLEQSGAAPAYYTEIPKEHTGGMLIVADWDNVGELGYRLGEAEIATIAARTGPSGLVGLLATSSAEAEELFRIPLLHEMSYSIGCVMTARHKEEARYQRRVLRQIMEECGGGALTNDMSWNGMLMQWGWIRATVKSVGTGKMLRSVPGFLGIVARDVRRHGWRRGLGGIPSVSYQSTIRMGSMIRAIFRFAGTFWTAMGALTTWDNAIRGCRVGEQVKRKYIDEGVIVDDGGDAAWGGLYEAGAYAHLEEICQYDQRDQTRSDRILEYIFETNLACIETHCGDSLNAVAPPSHALYSPACLDYDKYTQRIKATFDPANAADASGYTDPKFMPDARTMRAMENVMKHRAPITV
ncbi:MAG: FAD-dependent oxidoreductase [Candidatus Schekmanbacteria bacterium]|nr:FAD-dependent oxidoreductase [Candidatus Schekmanbacteria bacterium]